MKAAKIVLAILSVLLTGPIWYYLLYKILQAIHASELMWFLFWIYLPVAFLTGVISHVVLNVDKK